MQPSCLPVFIHPLSDLTTLHLLHIPLSFSHCLATNLLTSEYTFANLRHLPTHKTQISLPTHPTKLYKLISFSTNRTSHTNTKTHQIRVSLAPLAFFKPLSFSLWFSNYRCSASSSKRSPQPWGAGRSNGTESIVRTAGTTTRQQEDTFSRLIWKDCNVSYTNTSPLLLLWVFLDKCLQWEQEVSDTGLTKVHLAEHACFYSATPCFSTLVWSHHKLLMQSALQLTNNPETNGPVSENAF